jgi:DNA-binding FadR family transcriptional regulator
MEMRMIIEPKIANFAARRATASDIAQLEILAKEVAAHDYHSMDYSVS